MTHMMIASYPTQFSRRVSFNNLDPECVDGAVMAESDAWAGPGAFFKPNYSLSSKSPYDNKVPMDLGYGQALFSDVSKAFSQTTSRKKIKLPDPPSRSILKNKVSPQYIATETIDYHKDLEEVSREKEASQKAAAASARRKSYSEMSVDELMALDPQFQKPKTSDVNQFKFDSQKTYYLPARRASSTTTVSASQKAEYPSSNENNYRSISLTVKHKDFDNSSHQTRTLLSVLSGRRHTWNALDWLFDDAGFLQDGDCLVFAALIPSKYIREYVKKGRKPNINDHLYRKCESLLQYLITGPLCANHANLKLKITVEFVTDSDSDLHVGNKHMLQHLYKQYQPNLMVLGNKSGNLNFKYPIKMRRQKERDEYLIKLSSYIIKYSTVPVILVGNSTRFANVSQRNCPRPMITFCDGKSAEHISRAQKDTQRDTHTQKESQKESQPKKDKDEAKSDASKNSDDSKNDLTTVSSNSSAVSIESVESYTVSPLVQDEEELQKSLDALLSGSSESRFMDMVTAISDKSLGDSRLYLHAIQSKDDSLKVDSKIHSIYRSQTTGTLVTGSMLGGNGSRANSLSRRTSTESGASVYKVRSLVSYSPETSNDKLRSEYKKKRNSTSSTKRNSTSSLKSGKSAKEKKSIWQKLGLKK